MDETQRSLRNPADFSISDENDAISAKLAPVSVKAGLQLTKVYAELSENWKKFEEIEGGERIAAIMKDLTVEEQLERMEHMQMPELLNVVRFHLRKMTTIKEENNVLTEQNRELSAQLHRIEHRVGKAQVQVFQKMEGTIRQIVDDFHTRELDLARKLENLESENVKLTAKNENLAEKIVDFEKKTDNLEGKNREISDKFEEKERLFEKLAKKFDEISDENFELKEKLEQVKQRVREKEDEALQEAAEAQNLRVMIVKNKEEIWEKARRHEQDLKEQMDTYCSNLEHQMQTLRNKCKSDMEDLTREHRTAVFQKDAQIQKLAADLERKSGEVAKFERHLALMEAQIKGNVKRTLAVNYQEMMNIVSQGPSHIPTPPYSNPLLDLARDLELEKENLEKSKKRSVSDRSSGQPSPKRTIGVQARPEKPKDSRVARRLPTSHRK